MAAEYLDNGASQILAQGAGIETAERLAGDALLRAYCAEQELPLLAELPFERAAAESYARGRLPVLDSEAWRERFRLLRTALRHQAGEVRHA